ncbi:MAG TPA: hypothetical protein ENJ22_00030 [Gammaproteobacteria bacterium]|nr:hypothetical protein [Gammaproteobacteria bacterium]
MKLIFSKFFDICLLRAGPQDLPSSTLLLGLALLLYFVIGVLLTVISVSLVEAVVLVVADIALLGGLVYVLLWANNLLDRLIRVWTALLGSGAFFETLALPLLAWQQQIMDNAQSEVISLNETGVVVSSLLLWLVLFWNLIVIGHILRHALSTLLPIGIALSVAYMFISITLSQNLAGLFS